MTQPTTINEIRSAFLSFFEGHQHQVAASSAITPKDDPTLLFYNAGMAPLKDYFSGARTPPSRRMATSQKCVRAGGKHNDLDNVGYTARHHTFFEMLGNFSFGDYFKEQAIEFAWSFLTDRLQLPKDKLLVTVFHEDEEAADLWKKVAGLPDDRIIRIATEDNFWSMGDTGPCGPCSEIFYDHGPNIEGGPPGSPDEDGDRFVEIWNLVFMQFDKSADGTMTPLPKPCIDTGCGLERLAAALQGVNSNYDTELFRALIEASETVTGVSTPESQASHRVVADHLRTSAFLIAEGVLPSNEGRGYVLRRIMRRAMRHLHMLGTQDNCFHLLVDALVKQMGDHYVELAREQAKIEAACLAEEQQFRATLGRGLKILEKEVAELGNNRTFSGEVAFKLYDTYGFPLDLTQDVLRGQEIEVDTTEFHELMQSQKDRARKAWVGSGDTKLDSIWPSLAETLGATNFTGYAASEGNGKVIAIVTPDGQVDEISANGDRPTPAALVFDRTVFYGESGGQVGDQGQLSGSNGTSFVVEDTQKPVTGLIVHTGELTTGTIRVGDGLQQKIHADLRNASAANHSATHLLHAALHHLLGDHVAQKGSYVGPDRLRFDFSHSQAVTAEQLREIEHLVNQVVANNYVTRTEEMPLDQALETGAMAQFDEQYGDSVRVLSIGGELDNTSSDQKPFSVELCGGTHVIRAGDIGLFKIISEGSVGAGVRRIEAVTNNAALDFTEQTEQLLEELQRVTKSSRERLAEDITKLMAERKQLTNELKQFRESAALAQLKSMKPTEAAGAKFISGVVQDVAGRELKDLARRALSEAKVDALSLVSMTNGNAGVVVALSKAFSKKASAKELLAATLDAMGGGSGGGSPTLAQGAAQDVDNAEAGLTRFAAELQNLGG